MKIVDLVVLHNDEGNSDKVWGYFQDKDTGNWHKFWGKRMASGYQARPADHFELQQDKIKKFKRDYIENSGPQNYVFKIVKKTLEKQFEVSATSPKKKSMVTGKEMNDPIRPSKVARTEERMDEPEDDTDKEDRGLVIFFYDEFSNFLGKRPFSEKKAIFNHLRKTKEEVSNDSMTGLDSEGYAYTYINWEEKTPA